MIKEVVYEGIIRYIMTETELLRSDYSRDRVYSITTIYPSGKVVTRSYENFELANRVFEALTED